MSIVFFLLGCAALTLAGFYVSPVVGLAVMGLCLILLACLVAVGQAELAKQRRR